MKKRGVGKFVFGTALGVGLGMLFAPKKGSETRKELGTKIDELLNKVKEIDVDEVKCMLESKITEIETELKDLDNEKVLKIAKAKGKELKAKSEEEILTCEMIMEGILSLQAGDNHNFVEERLKTYLKPEEREELEEEL